MPPVGRHPASLPPLIPIPACNDEPLPLLQLPPEVVGHIASYLPPTDPRRLQISFLQQRLRVEYAKKMRAELCRAVVRDAVKVLEKALSQELVKLADFANLGLKDEFELLKNFWFKNVATLPPDAQIDVLLAAFDFCKKSCEKMRQSSTQATRPEEYDLSKFLLLDIAISLFMLGPGMLENDTRKIEILRTLANEDIFPYGYISLANALVSSKFNGIDEIFYFAKKAIAASNSDVLSNMEAIGGFKFFYSNIKNYLFSVTSYPDTFHRNLRCVELMCLVGKRAAENIVDWKKYSSHETDGFNSVVIKNSCVFVVNAIFQQHIISVDDFEASVVAKLGYHGSVRASKIDNDGILYAGLMRVLNFYNHNHINVSAMEKLSKNFVDDDVFASLGHVVSVFFSEKIKAPNFDTNSEKYTETADHFFQHLISVDIRWFPSHQQAPKFQQFLTWIDDFSQGPCSLAHSLALLPSASSRVYQKIKETHFYQEQDNVSQARLEKITLTLKNKIDVHLEKLGDKTFVFGADIDSLVALTKILQEDIFSNEEKKICHEKIFSLLSAVDYSHPKLLELWEGVDLFNNNSHACIDYRAENIKMLADKVIYSRQLGLYQGIDFLLNLDKKLRGFFPLDFDRDDVIPDIKDMMRNHFNLVNFDAFSLEGVSKFTDSPYKKWIQRVFTKYLSESVVGDSGVINYHISNGTAIFSLYGRGYFNIGCLRKIKEITAYPNGFQAICYSIDAVMLGLINRLPDYKELKSGIKSFEMSVVDLFQDICVLNEMKESLDIHGGYIGHYDLRIKRLQTEYTNALITQEQAINRALAVRQAGPAAAP
jgi:hypothetical protein